MKGRSLKGLINISLIMVLTLLLSGVSIADEGKVREDMAEWKKHDMPMPREKEDEVKWRRLSDRRRTASELKRLREEAIASQPRSPEDKVITIRRGDTLWDLSDEYFKNPWLWPRLWSYDGNLYISNPHKIYPGKELTIPSEEVASRIGLKVREPVEPVVRERIPTLREDKAVADRLRKEIELLGKIKNDREGRIAQLHQEIIDLKAKDIERERVKRELAGELEDALTDRKIYEATVVAKKVAEIARLSREVEELKEKIYFLENELAKKESEIKAKEELIMAQEATIGNQISQINRLSSELDDERKEMEQFFAFIGVIGGIIALSLSN